VIIEGNSISADETPSDDFLEHELKELMAEGHALSSVHIHSIHACTYNILQENGYVIIFLRSF
jgi:hypothetical protein